VSRFTYDDSITGAVRPRDGAIEKLVFADPGGYLSADAFHLDGSAHALRATRANERSR
jgi:hypothetical protein